ncbi:MAG: DUF6798 domain-containing protein, partial [Cyanobacteria bacterium P01_D01_bin.2]
YPVATVAKLQFARTTPFILLMALTAIAVYASEYYHRGHWLLALCLMVAPVIDNAGGLIALILVGLSLFKPGPKQLWQSGSQRFSTAFWLLHALFLIGLTATYTYHLALFLSFVYPFLLDEFPTASKKIRLAGCVTIAVCALFVSLHMGGVIVHRSLGPVHRAIKLFPLVDHPVKKLATGFGQSSSKDALVLVPPADRMFRYYSQRSIVVSFKSFPFTDAGIVTWEERLENMVGELPGSAEDKLDPIFAQRTGAEIGAISAQYGATHILTRQDWHADIPGGTAIDQQEDWVLWAVDSPSNQTQLF